MTQPRIELEHVDVVLSGRKVLRDLSWRLCPGEHWGVLGRNGSGKTSFLKLLKGELWPAPGPAAGPAGTVGRRTYRLDGRESRSVAGLAGAFGYVSPELQAAYVRAEWSVPALEIVLSGPSGGLRLYQEPAPALVESALALLERYGLAGLRNRPLHELSTGQGRKVLLCRALAASPRVLLLDEFLDGVDASSRPDLLRAVEEAAAGGSQVVMATHRTDDLIPAIGRILVLDRGRSADQGERAGVLARLRPGADLDGPAGGAERPRRPAPGPAGRTAAGYVLRIERASVDYGGAAALREVDWEVLPGEGWAVSGPNGAGKSTLLKLILGDVQPLPGGRVRRFGQTARSGRMSIWEIKQRIGSVSAEFQARYAQAATAEEVVLSGLEASIGVYREFSAEERDLARRWLEFFGLAEVAGVELARLSNGQQRRALLARAMMTGPELLLLDEPCAGLDAESRRELLGFLVRLRTLGTAVVYVTHHPGEVAGLGLRELRLERGRVVGNSADERAGASGAKAQGGGA